MINFEFLFSINNSKDGWSIIYWESLVKEPTQPRILRIFKARFKVLQVCQALCPSSYCLVSLDLVNSIVDNIAAEEHNSACRGVHGSTD